MVANAGRHPSGGADMTQVRLDKAELGRIAAECIAIADKLRDARSVHGGRYLGQTWKTSTPLPNQDPKQLLGTAEYPHAGRLAGQRLADSINAGETVMSDAETTLRDLATRLTEALADFDDQEAGTIDQLTELAADLARERRLS